MLDDINEAIDEQVEESVEEAIDDNKEELQDDTGDSVERDIDHAERISVLEVTTQAHDDAITEFRTTFDTHRERLDTLEQSLENKAGTDHNHEEYVTRAEYVDTTPDEPIELNAPDPEPTEEEIEEIIEDRTPRVNLRLFK